MDDPKRARSWKRRIQPRDNLKAVEPVPYSTRNFTPIFLQCFDKLGNDVVR